MGKLIFCYSAMNAGKSASLILRAHRYLQRDIEILVYVARVLFPKELKQYSQLTSRTGLSLPAQLFDETTKFSLKREKDRTIRAIFVDEAQFLTQKQVNSLHLKAHLRDISVICYGIRTDVAGNLFPGSASLLALADSIEEIETICSCGRKATMNILMDKKGRRVYPSTQICVEGEESQEKEVFYDEVCGACFYPNLSGITPKSKHKLPLLFDEFMATLPRK